MIFKYRIAFNYKMIKIMKRIDYLVLILILIKIIFKLETNHIII